MDYSKFGGVWNKSKLSAEEEEMGVKLTSSVPLIHEPETPNESMEFLSRSWSISAEEISRALAKRQKVSILEKFPSATYYETVSDPPHAADRVMGFSHSKRISGIGKWFHHSKDANHGSFKKKDKARAENAHVHAALSVASLAAGLAAVSAAQVGDARSDCKMSKAVASAAELLASRCIEMAEQAGAEHDRVTLSVGSAVDVRSPGDLITLTAAAATALRAEAALSSRLPKEPKRNAAISPYDRSFTDVHSVDPFLSEAEEMNPPCVGDLMQHTTNGALRWKRVSVYINKKSQVMIKLKSKHVGGAFSKNDKCLVYGVSDDTSTSPFKNIGRESPETYFGLQTAQGFLEFKCKNKIHKQEWVERVGSLLCQVDDAQAIGNSIECMDLNKRH